ncbi:methylated-DNA--[protein]-cysteine S-methyltransferase [Gemmobacter serpentinus]|uniref:methylated-DNA--[protein]-cysteine S-methyltransferase n=1 Tax=Gemmobacter serpentinus TaxID=2652247 RepID=UPI00124EB17E|nr:methylated-DNA--[protein]-cysteine S-methyltransferase [Gemmobacter serpentinus]
MPARITDAASLAAVLPKLLGHDLVPRDQARLMADCLATPLGPMIAVSDGAGLLLLEFTERDRLLRELRQLSLHAKARIAVGPDAVTARLEGALNGYFAGQGLPDLPLVPLGTPFQQAVWRALQAIPAGRTTTYGALAASLGRSDAVRAVAAANGANPLAILVPCHRVVAADGKLTGYGAGLWRKAALLGLESGAGISRESLDGGGESA